MEQLNCLRCEHRHEDNGNCTLVGGFCTAIPAAHCPLLQEYLDTGLTPEQCKESFNIVMSLSTECGIGVRRVAELANADRDGRVVVYDTREEAEEALRRDETV